MSQRNFRQRRLEEPEPPEGGGEEWLNSYADMISLLFALFVVLYGMSKVNEESFKQLAEALSKSLSTKSVAADVQIKTPEESKEPVIEIEKKEQVRQMFQDYPVDGPDNLVTNKQNVKVSEDDGGTPSKKEMKALDEIEKELRKALEAQGIKDAVVIRMNERGLVVSLMTDKLLFEIGEAELTGNCKKILDAVSPVINKCNNPIRIEGNTCDLPIRTSRFYSNWELSTMRSTNVAKYIITKRNVKPERISIIGYGEYQPLFPNTSEQNRARNRRVDILFQGSTRQILSVSDGTTKGTESEPVSEKPASNQEQSVRGFWDTLSGE